MSKELVIKDKDAKKLLEDVKTSFVSMQRSWFVFGKTISQIYESKAWVLSHPEAQFSEYCESEFSSLSYQNIMKIIAVVKAHGEAIETRVKKDSTYKIPTYDACYQVVVIADKKDIPKEEVSKFKKDVLDGRMLYRDIKARLKEIFSKRTEKTKEEIEKSSKELQTKLVRELEGEDLDGFDQDDFEEVEDEDTGEADLDEVDEDEDTGIESAITATQVRVDYLNDNLRDLIKRVESDGVSDEATTLAEKLEKLHENIDKFLIKYEAMND